jgi:hypothetical protein
VPHNNQSGVKRKDQSRKHPPLLTRQDGTAKAGQAKSGKYEELLTTHLHLLTLNTKNRRQNSMGLFNIPA